MRRLWIADVHANLTAFQAVLADAGEVDETVFLGDVVGCGPHPADCVDLLKQTGAKAIRGNHDASVLAIADRDSRSDDPISWNEWTFDQLNEEQLSYLSNLPAELTIDSCGTSIEVMHHPAGVPYIHPAMPDAVLADYFQGISHPVVFCGHCHRGVDRTVNGCRYVCIPSVGQPRNRDPRAGYALEQDGNLEFHFVTYDVEAVAADVQNIGLDEAFCHRWLNFLRAGFDSEWSREYGNE